MAGAIARHQPEAVDGVGFGPGEVLELRLTAADVARARFASSPLCELVDSVRALRDPTAQVVHRPWVAAARERLAGVDLRPLLAIVPAKGYIADFLTPPPLAGTPALNEELERLRATPADQVRSDVLRSLGPGPVGDDARAFLERPRTALDRLAALLHEYWDRALAPDWPRVQALLEREVAYRARQEAGEGLGALLSDLHPAVSWHEGTVRVRGRSGGRVVLDGAGLTLVPSAFIWPLAAGLVAPSAPPALFYPARGVGTLWAPEAGGEAALSALLGGTRAGLLEVLATPASTSRLALDLELSAGAVSHHLTVMLRAGLLTRQRAGRRVLYEISPLGQALLIAASPPE